MHPTVVMWTKNNLRYASCNKIILVNVFIFSDLLVTLCFVTGSIVTSMLLVVNILFHGKIIIEEFHSIPI